MKARRKAHFLFFLAIFFTSSAVCSALTSQECLDCHTDADIVSSPLDPAALKASVHDGLDCADCHTDVVDAPHETKPKPVSCTSCHDDKELEPSGSFHQSLFEKSPESVPQCVTCHSAPDDPHKISASDAADSSVHESNIPVTCGKCHADPVFIEERKINIPGAFLKRYAKLTHNAKESKNFSTHPSIAANNIPVPPEEENCFLCHGDTTFEKFVDKQVYQSSAHGKNRCTGCHTDAVGSPHPQKLKPVDCSQCHRLETQIYLASDHGKAVASGISEAASCKSCHGETHTILNSRDPNSPVNRAHIPETCARCHDDPKIMSDIHLFEPHPIESYMKSVHGVAHLAGKKAAAVCTDCHGSHDLHGKLNTESKIYKLNVPKTCGHCHENVEKTYDMSVHGKAIQEGIIDAPVCTDCHGEHQIQGPKGTASPVSLAHVVETCSHCHASEKINSRYGLPADRIETYLKSYHGLARQAGSLIAANCASCHGFHDILPSSDRRSSVYPSNLAMTCGKCHPGAGSQLAGAKIHVSSDSPGSFEIAGQSIVHLAKRFYSWLIVLLIGLMLVHNALDFFRKLWDDEKEGHDLKEERMSLNERIQHFVLIIAFVGLGYTGLCHRYPRAFWAIPIMSLEGGSDIRRFLHRAFAVVFVVLGTYHFLWLIFTEKGRGELRKLAPNQKDAREAVELIGYNAGLRKGRPVRSGKYSYIEKMEYWALIWGTGIMALTGFFLTFENWTLKYFPKWVVDLMLTVHFYEALLAMLAILVWHFYWTVFDPSVYPMNWAWLTGFVKRKKNGKDSGKHE